jgi:hypothetical protein
MLGAAPYTGGYVNESSSAILGSLQSSLVEDSTFAPATRTLYGSATAYDMPAQSVFLGGSNVSRGGAIEATLLVPGLNAGTGGTAIENAQMTGLNDQSGPGRQVVNLRKGNVVIAADHDTVLETPFARVTVKAKSMALIMALPGGTAVYNLDDSHKDSVVIAVGENQMTLTPGRHATITSHLVDGFEMINPVESFAYRNLSRTKLNSDLQVYTSEYSLPDAIRNIKQLRAMFSSSHPEVKRKVDHLLKTTAIVSQLTAGGQYQQYQHPRMTAYALVK